MNITAEITAEWLEVFAKDKANEVNLSDSIFWRLALHTLPEGVDTNNPQVQRALAEIRRSCEERKGENHG